MYGVNLQYLSRNVNEATVKFVYSCNSCCHSPRAMYCNCDNCAIEIAHNFMVASFRDAEKARLESSSVIEQKEVECNE